MVITQRYIHLRAESTNRVLAQPFFNMVSS